MKEFAVIHRLIYIILQGRSHRSDRDRSDSRDRDSRRRNRSSRNDKDSGRSSIDKRSSVEAETKPMNTAIPPNQMNPMNPMYQQNVPFNSNITQFMMKQMNSNGNNVAGVAAAAAAGAVGAGVGMPNMAQNEQMSAFSTNDVRTMNMNMTMQTNPLAFQQHMFNQQPPPTANMPPFNAFAQPPNSMGGNLPPQLAVAAAAGMGGVASSATGGNKFGGSHVAHNGNGNGGPAGNHHNMSHKITCCVRVRNLCNLTNYSAIRKFFAGLLIPNDGIKMINDMDGNRTGQAYVRFARPNFVMQAIQRSNQKLGRNVIQIQELDEKTYDEAIDSYRPPRRNHNNNNSGNNYRSDHDRNDNRDRDREYRSGGRNSRFKRNSRDYSDDDDDDDDRTSSRGSRGSCGNSDNEHDNDVMCISDSNDSKDSAPFTTVLIEDLPPFTKEQDIMKLFSSYPLVHIVMAKRSKMFSSYVRFHSADDAKAAVKNTACHKISFKTVYISACSEEEFETARKEFSGELDLDIGRPPMKSVEENRSSAMDKNDSSDIKSPDTTTLQNDDYATEESNEMTSNAQSSSMDMSAAAAPSSSSSSSSVPMHGISLESIPGINLADPRINASKFPFLAAAAGAAGSASSSTEMENKHSTPTNERIDPRTRAAVQPPMHNNNAFNNFDMMQQQQQQHQQGGPAQHQSQFQPAGGMMDPSMSEVCCILIENMEYRTTEAEIVDWIQHKCNLVPIRIQLLVNDRNQTNGNGFIQFASNAQAVQAMERLDKAQFKSRVVHISLAPWPQIMMTIQQLTQVLRENGFDGIDTSGNQPRSRFNNNNNNGNRFQNNRFNNGNNGGGGGGNNGRMNNRPNNRNGNNSQMSGNVVSMSNVPYKASIEDILDFFSDFDMTPEDIIRRYNDEGKPTGDLRVRFESPAEARRAIDLKDKCRLANRPVYLQLFNY